ncbi:MAG: nuclear transport factor 2 family protein [Bacteroidota bacterium]
MSDNTKSILVKANEAITRGDHEGFLKFCTENTRWEFVGEQVLQGKQAVREWMKIAYQEPPIFVVENLIGDSDFVAAVGTIDVKDENGKKVRSSYCDVWRFEAGKLADLKAFVIPQTET